MAEVIQPSQVELIKNRDQVIFAWTDAKSDARTIKNLKEIGVDGVIYDRVDLYKKRAHSQKRVGPVVFSTKIQEELEKKARSPKSRCSCTGM